MADANTGASGLIRLSVSESNLNAAARTSQINYTFQLIERVTSNSTWTGNSIGASVEVHGNAEAIVFNGSFGGFDWRPAGNQTTTIASGNFPVQHNADGSGSVSLIGKMAATGTTGAGGPAQVTQGLTLTKLTVAPGTPTSFTATRTSDTAIALAWHQSNASNGTPTSTDIDVSVNGGAYANKVDIGNATSASVSAAANQKLVFRVRSSNSAGTTAFATSNAVYTTPAAPTNAVATKQPNLDIKITFTENVGYAEYTHEVWHGTVAGGVTTWDGAALATLASGVLTYTDVAPDAGTVHIYRVRAKAGALASGYATTAAVQLLAPPNKPTVPAMSAITDVAVDRVYSWTHNPVDTTEQTAYEVGYSTDGGTTWASTGKVVSSASSYTVVAGTYPANTALTLRVRTWGQATTGGSDGAGASPWSDLRTTTYKTAPVATITAPADGDTLTDATVRVTLGFAQAQAATFVKGQIELYASDDTLLEQADTVIQIGVPLATQVQDDSSYYVRARVQDSNGLWSAWARSDFDVNYLSPVPAVATTSYLPDNGYGQIDLTIADPDDGQEAAATVTITRTINGVTEVVVQDYPADSALSFLDTTPTINGTNTYTITTSSELGAQISVTAVLVTSECRRAYLSKGAGFNDVVIFGANLSVSEDLSVASDTIQAAGRTRPIGLYGMETSVQLKVESFIFEGFGSTIDQLRAILLVPGQACYRDSSGRRVFGSVKGSIDYKKTTRGNFSFTITEAD